MEIYFAKAKPRPAIDIIRDIFDDRLPVCEHLQLPALIKSGVTGAALRRRASLGVHCREDAHVLQPDSYEVRRCASEAPD